MTETMRKILASLLSLLALLALVGLIATAIGMDPGGSPMLFARALVISVGLLVITLRWRRRGLRSARGK